MVRPAAAQIVTGHALVVVVAGRVRSCGGGAVDPTLKGTFRALDDRVVQADVVVVVLDVAIDSRFEVDGKPRFTLLPVCVLARGVFPTLDFELVVSAISAPGDVVRGDVEDFGDTESGVAHQSERDFCEVGVCLTRELSILGAIHPDVPRAVLVPFGSHRFTFF